MSRHLMLLSALPLALLSAGCSCSDEQDSDSSVAPGESAEPTDSEEPTDSDDSDEPEAVLEMSDVSMEGSEDISLVAVMRWSTNIETSAAVEFGLDGEFTQVVDYGTQGTEHEVIVVGMHPETEYQLRALSVSPGGQELRSEAQSFVTGTMPEPWMPLLVDIHDEQRAQQGWTLANIATDYSSPTYVVMIDMEGLPVWYYYYGKEGRSDVVPKLVDQDHVLIGPGVPTGSTPIVVDLAGNITWQGPEQDLAFVDGGLHHIFHELSTGEYLFVEFTEQGTSMGDTIRTYDQDLNETWSWCSFDHLEDHPSWVHTNSVWPDEENDLLYTNAYQMDKIFKIDWTTGEVLWTLGEGGDFAPDPSAIEPWPQHAHTIQLLDDMHLLVYDNGVSDRGYTRVVEYAIDEKNMTTEIVWQYPGQLAYDPWWCAAWGDTDRLANGNTLINAGAGPGSDTETVSRIFEVTPEGEIVWQAWWYEEGALAMGAYAADRVEPIAQPIQ